MTGDSAGGPRLTRRRVLAFAVMSSGATLGCRLEPSSCDEVGGLSALEARGRAALEYEDRARDPARSCSGCRQFIEPRDFGSCGRCQLVPGRIHPRGTCRAFSARPKRG